MRRKLFRTRTDDFARRSHEWTDDKTMHEGGKVNARSQAARPICILLYLHQNLYHVGMLHLLVSALYVPQSNTDKVNNSTRGYTGL